jgi:rhamnosyl/mannosyltransferase
VEWAEIAHFHASSPTPETAHFVFGVPDATPVVVTFHAEPGASSRWKHLRPIYTPVLRSLLHRADRITATAPANISHTDLLQDFEHKTEVIPLATEFPVDPPPDVERERRQQKLLGEDEKPVILFVGRLVYCKGLRYLLRAMQHVEAHLLVVGKGKMLEDLQAKTHSLEISGKVRFEGYVPEEHLGDYYRAADLFVLPSIAPTEAFGIVQLEAMAHGLPVINTDLPTGVPFVSQDEKTGLTVPPKDPDALAAALNQLIDDKEYRHRLGRNAAKRATAFTKEKMVDQYETLYEEILS